MNVKIKNPFERMQKGAVATLRTVCFFIYVFLFFLSCGSKKESDESVQSLEGTKWKLAGIIDVKTGALKVLDPKDCEKCYTFSFDTDSTASGITIANHLLVRLRPVLYFNIATEALDCHESDCALFYEAIKSMVCYKSDKNGLKFYFDEQRKYLYFKQLNN